MRGSEPFRRQRWSSLLVPRARRTRPRPGALDAAFLVQPRARAHAFDLVAFAAVRGADRADVHDHPFRA